MSVAIDLIQIMQTQGGLTSSTLQKCFDKQKVLHDDHKEILEHLQNRNKICQIECTGKIVQEISSNRQNMIEPTAKVIS